MNSGREIFKKNEKNKFSYTFNNYITKLILCLLREQPKNWLDFAIVMLAGNILDYIS
jgi:hypothetical protein